MKIEWKLHLSSSPHKVYQTLDSDLGRASFWADSAVERDHKLHFTFSNGWTYVGEILKREPDREFWIMYFDSKLEIRLDEDGSGGTDLSLAHHDVSQKDFAEVHAGWISVLLTLKAAVDHGIDLRNHDPARSWDQGYVDN